MGRFGGFLGGDIAFGTFFPLLELKFSYCWKTLLYLERIKSGFPAAPLEGFLLGVLSICKEIDVFALLF